MTLTSLGTDRPAAVTPCMNPMAIRSLYAITPVLGLAAHCSAACDPPRIVGRKGPSRRTWRSRSKPASRSPRQRIPSAHEASGPAK